MNPMIPIEGIDKIKVFLSPFFINYTNKKIKFLISYDNKKAHLDPHNGLTLHRSGWFTSLAIHAEFCDPLIDYHMNIAKAIYELINSKIIAFPDNGILTLAFVYNNLKWFILGVQELELYFDIRRSNILVDDDAVDNGDLIKVHNTFYTPDYRGGKHKRKSIGIIYDKDEKNRRDNHISHQTLDKYPYQNRLEFRLNSMNCKYLSVDNLRGDYKEIIKRYCGYLGIQYGLYFRRCVEITGRDNKQLRKVVRISRDAGKRYRGKELKKTSPIKVSPRDLDNEGRERMQTILLRQFYSETGTSQEHQE
jgi:hypothetical protein